jgi:regulatory protein
MTRSSSKGHAGPLTREELENAALRYLNRFDTSVSNLRRVLAGYVSRVEQKRGAEAAAPGTALIEELLSRYADSGLVDDARYASSLAAGLRQRGKSSRAILQTLKARGISAEMAAVAVGQLDAGSPGAEIEAARAFAKRRRIGPYRPEETRDAYRQRDLGALARAGFSFDVARRALGASGNDGDDGW